MTTSQCRHAFEHDCHGEVMADGRCEMSDCRAHHAFCELCRRWLDPELMVDSDEGPACQGCTEKFAAVDGPRKIHPSAVLLADTARGDEATAFLFTDAEHPYGCVPDGSQPAASTIMEGLCPGKPGSARGCFCSPPKQAPRAAGESPAPSTSSRQPGARRTRLNVGRVKLGRPGLPGPLPIRDGPAPGKPAGHRAPALQMPALLAGASPAPSTYSAATHAAAPSWKGKNHCGTGGRPHAAEPHKLGTCSSVTKRCNWAGSQSGTPFYCSSEGPCSDARQASPGVALYPLWRRQSGVPADNKPLHTDVGAAMVTAMVPLERCVASSFSSEVSV